MARFDVHNEADRAYLAALAFGDFHVSRHGRKIRVEASSTHRAQVELVEVLFAEHGRRIHYAFWNGRGAAWRVVFDLDRTFSFLLAAEAIVRRGLTSEKLLLPTLAGLIDSEGHVGLIRRGKTSYPVATVSNCNRAVMRLLLTRLRSQGYPANLQSHEYSKGAHIFQVAVRGRKALQLIANLPLRHEEKIISRQIISKVYSDQKNALDEYRSFRDEIAIARDDYVSAASDAFLSRKIRRANRARKFQLFAASALAMKQRGMSITAVGISLGRSERTVYRLLSLAGKPWNTGESPTGLSMKRALTYSSMPTTQWIGTRGMIRPLRRQRMTESQSS